MKARMTDPRSYMLRMVVILAVTLIIIGLLFNQLASAFSGNLALNSVIVATALIGVAFIFRQTWRLVPEAKWLSDIQKTNTISQSAPRPVLLATVHVMLSDASEDGQLSALSLRSVLDGVAARLDEAREISRYFIGLLVFLGLLGTFWGLLQTIGSVGRVVGGLDLSSTDFDAMMSQLRNGLDAPLAGMATAFSSSLFGLGGSLVIGFLDLQLGQAMGRFFNEVEDWLSVFAKFSDLTASRSDGGQQALAQGLSEEGARAMITLASAIDAAQRDRTEQTRQITSLNTTLAVLSEQMADDRRLREQLAQLNIQIQQLTSSLDEKARLQQETVSTELRALSTAIVKLAGKK
ncbi:MAG: MotA/TolQ/ExbB proton channel family protein [Candidatus Puniceispirillaceae bacterium]